MRTAYRLTITKIINNVLFMKAIRHMFGNFSLIEASNIKNELPYVLEGLCRRPKEIESYFLNNCEYIYQEYAVPEKNIESPSERYIDAYNWYLTLSKEDRDKVDILVNMVAPYA